MQPASEPWAFVLMQLETAGHLKCARFPTSPLGWPDARAAARPPRAPADPCYGVQRPPVARDPSVQTGCFWRTRLSPHAKWEHRLWKIVSFWEAD